MEEMITYLERQLKKTRELFWVVITKNRKVDNFGIDRFVIKQSFGAEVEIN